MKRLLPVFLAAILLLSACSGTAQPGGTVSPDPDFTLSPSPSGEPDALVFTRENMPRLNGSTSTIPLAQAVASVLLGESRDEVADLAQFSKTTASYRSLMNGESDLLIAAEPAKSIYEEKEQSGFEWVMEPLAMDALVFVVNKDNPVDSITTEQLQKIYTGEITNWSQVGGDDIPITPFQRNAEAGSQTLMLKLVMDGLTMTEPPTEQIILSMEGLVDAVRGYDNDTGAIGYTVYYYANDMNMAEGLKLLAIDGVTPNADSIRSGAYPFLNPYYVVMSANQAEDSPTGILFQWLLGDEGQSLIAHEGYVSIKE